MKETELIEVISNFARDIILEKDNSEERVTSVVDSILSYRDRVHNDAIDLVLSVTTDKETQRAIVKLRR